MNYKKYDSVVIIDARMLGYTGIGKYIYDLLRYACKHGADYPFNVVALRRPNDMCSLKIQSLISTSRVFSINEQFEIPKIIKGAKLLHVPQFNVPLLTHIPMIVTIHDLAFDKMPQERRSTLAYAYYKFLISAALKKSIKIITVSQATKEDLINIYGIPEKKILVIHRGIDVDYFRNTKVAENIWAKLKEKFSLYSLYILYVGLIRPRKNIKNLLIATQMLYKKLNFPFKLVMAGPCDNRFINVSKLAANLAIKEIVIQTSYLSEIELLSLYRHASMLILPSFLEGFGLPILEAMACDIPVIASDIPAHREIAVDAALLVNPYNPEQICQAMKQLFNDYNLREYLRQKGRERVSKFSWQECAKKTFDVYAELLNERR